MGMSFDQTRNQGVARQINCAGVARRLDFGGRTDGFDPVSADEYSPAAVQVLSVENSGRTQEAGDRCILFGGSGKS